MASVSHNKRTGARAVLVICPDGKRRPIRLGKVTKAQAGEVKRHVEHLANFRLHGSALPPSTAEWLANVPDRLRERLIVCGLTKSRAQADVPTLGQWLEQYVAERQDVKPATLLVYGHTRRNLLTFFGADKRLDAIAPGDADSFAVYLRTAAQTTYEEGNDDEPSGLSDNTVRRRLGIAKQFFRAAVRRKLIAENPFDGQVTTVRDNPRRRYFVTREETATVLNALPDAKWRLVFAMCRYAGLRCPSEVARLKWADVSWDSMRFTAHATKTEHHADAGIRVVPIFPELSPYLRDAFEVAEVGAVYCCPQYPANIVAQMYRKVTLAAFTSAGVKPWPKLFQNCRASRETELAERYPVQVVCQWIGNSPAVAAKHYLQVTEDHYRSAAQKATQQVRETPEMTCHAGEENGAKPNLQATADAFTPLHITIVGVEGLEPPTSWV